jgi:hypothetical protein
MYRLSAAGLFIIFLFAGCQSRIANREVVARCLPKGEGITLETTFRDGGDPHGRIITVEQKLIKLKAHVGSDGKLRDGDGNLIFFFQGLNYQGIKPMEGQEQRVKEERERLQRSGTVIEMAPVEGPK